MVSRLFPLFAIVSLAAAVRARLGVAGTLGGALTALIWAGLVRMMVLHHVTWSVNSICHVFGRQPFTREGPQHELRAARGALVRRVVAQLPPRAPVVGAPRCAARTRSTPRRARSVCSSALGWATKVRWPTRGAARGVARLGS